MFVIKLNKPSLKLPALLLMKTSSSSVLFLAWSVVFKIPRGVRPPGFSSVNAFWTASGHYNGEDVTAMRDFTASSKLYKSKWLDDWNKRSFSAVCICKTYYDYLHVLHVRITFAV